MEIRNLIEITPEIRKEAFGILMASKNLFELVNAQNGHVGMSLTTGRKEVTIYDRHEYGEGGEHDLGFYVHRFFDDGTYQLDFINEDTDEGREFDEEFNKAFYPDEVDEDENEIDYSEDEDEYISEGNSNE